MRFATSTAFLVLFFAIFTVAFSTRIVGSDSIHDGLTQNYLVRRADEDSSATGGHSQASASSSAHASAATDASATASTSSKKESKSSSNAETDATATATAAAKKKNNSSFASPEILQTGTLFYVGVSVTTLLWITGKAIDVQTNRQERYAESLVHSI